MFPIISTIHDVLPAIKGRKDIKVSDKGDYTVITYAVQSKDLFNDPEHGKMRRECRGLIFRNSDGKIISRPFHKFFNMNETEETLQKNINIFAPHVVQEKMDGSMVRPFFKEQPGGPAIAFATKSGETDISELAHKAFMKLDNVDEKLDWIRDKLLSGQTPIFEFVSPFNQIVVPYEKEDFVFLALRDNVYGNYIRDRSYPGTLVKEHGYIDGIRATLHEYMMKTKGDVNREGDVLVFRNGFRVKVKSEWYVTAHKAKESLNIDRHIARMTLEDTFDDVVANIPEAMKEEVISKSQDFINKYYEKYAHLETMISDLDRFMDASFTDPTHRGNIRKNVAVNFVPSLLNPKMEAQFVYAHMGSKELEGVYKAVVLSHTNSEKRYNRLMEWLDEKTVPKYSHKDRDVNAYHC